MKSNNWPYENALQLWQTKPQLKLQQPSEKASFFYTRRFRVRVIDLTLEWFSRIFIGNTTNVILNKFPLKIFEF